MKRISDEKLLEFVVRNVAHTKCLVTSSVNEKTLLPMSRDRLIRLMVEDGAYNLSAEARAQIADDSTRNVSDCAKALSETLSQQDDP